MTTPHRQRRGLLQISVEVQNAVAVTVTGYAKFPYYTYTENN